MPGEKISFKVKFLPREIGKYEGQVRLFITDNPYENLIIDLRGEAYIESIVLEGLELTNIKFDFNEKRESNIKSRKSLKTNITVEGNKFTKTIYVYKLVYEYNYRKYYIILFYTSCT